MFCGPEFHLAYIVSTANSVCSISIVILKQCLLSTQEIWIVQSSFHIFNSTFWNCFNWVPWLSHVMGSCEVISNIYRFTVYVSLLLIDKFWSQASRALLISCHIDFYPNWRCFSSPLTLSTNLFFIYFPYSLLYFSTTWTERSYHFDYVLTFHHRSRIGWWSKNSCPGWCHDQLLEFPAQSLLRLQCQPVVKLLDIEL